MLRCSRCSALLDELADAIEAAYARTPPDYERWLAVDVKLSAHVADDHRRTVGEPHTGCVECTMHSICAAPPERLTTHLARDLYLPPELARGVS